MDLKPKSALSENSRIRRNCYRLSFVQRLSVLKSFANTGLYILIHFGAIAVLSLFMLICFDFLTQWNYFSVQDITVTGNRKLSKEEIFKKAEIYSGINILSVNLTRARDLLLSDPWIIEAEVVRDLPSVIHVKIREEKPLAVFELSPPMNSMDEGIQKTTNLSASDPSAIRYLVNEHGELFKKWDDSDPYYLPVVTGLSYADISVGREQWSTPYASVMEMLRIVMHPNSRVPISLIKSLHIDRELGITLYMFNQIRWVKMGYGHYTKKIVSLSEILHYAKENLLSGDLPILTDIFPSKSQDFRESQSNFDIESIDLNNPERIVITPAKTGAFASEHKEV